MTLATASPRDRPFIMYSFHKAEKKQILKKKEDVVEAFVALCNDEKFRRLLVSQPRAIITRAEAWERTLQRVLDA